MKPFCHLLLLLTAMLLEHSPATAAANDDIFSRPAARQGAGFLDSGPDDQSPAASPKAPGGQVLDQGDEFLPVTQAYQLSAIIADGYLHLHWQIAPGYYLYRDRFRIELLTDDRSAARLEPEFTPGLVKYDDYYEKNLEVYYGDTSILIPLTQRSQEQYRVQSQGCADAGLCYPPRTQLLRVDTDTGLVQIVDLDDARPGPGPRSEPLPPTGRSPSSASLPLALLLAFAGGIILNLMPCVFPVLSIKAVGLAAAHLGPHGRHAHGLAYTAGIVFTFVVMAALLLVFRAGGHAVGWGFQLQSTLFVTILAYLFFLMALSFSGLLSLGQGLMGVGQKLTQGQGLKASFMTGALASVVASPCTAPFMGTALGFALTQPAPVATLIFVSLGFGMATPFLLLSWWPALAARFPAPGPWMQTLQQFLAFPLYLSSVWLLWVLGRQTDTDTMSRALLGLVLLAFAVWLRARRAPALKSLAIAALLLAVALPAMKAGPSAGASAAEPFSNERLAQLRRQGDAIFVNVTADWCITCLANEKLALSSDTFARLLQDRNIHYLKGDWTNYNPDITALLEAYGRTGVPLYLYFAKNSGPVKVLPQLLTEARVVDALTH